MEVKFNDLIDRVSKMQQTMECEVNLTSETSEFVHMDRYEALHIQTTLHEVGQGLADLRDEVIEALTPEPACACDVASYKIEDLTDGQLLAACKEIWTQERSAGIYPTDESSLIRRIYNAYQGGYFIRTIETLVVNEAAKRFKDVVKLLMIETPVSFFEKG